jgi:hypothetical protein
MVVYLCEKFHCLPSQIDEESTEVLRLLKIVQMGTPDEEAAPQED